MRLTYARSRLRRLNGSAKIAPMTEPVAIRCRISAWEGASLWTFDVHLTPARRTTLVHAHHAIQLTLAVEGRFAFDLAGGRVEGPLVLIAPDVPHAFEPEGRYALLFAEPEGREGAGLLRLLAGEPVRRLDPASLGEAAAALAPIWAVPRLPDAEMARLGRGLLEALLGPAPPRAALDPRLARAIAWAERLGEEPATLPAAAAIACLSESRFSHLFVQETGLPFRTWLLWRRLVRAVEARGAGASLTEATHRAGFADQAHLSRTFLRMFGIQPSALAMA